MIDFSWSDYNRLPSGRYYWFCRNCATAGKRTNGEEDSIEACKTAFKNHNCHARNANKAKKKGEIKC